MTSVHKGPVTRKDVSDAFKAAEDAIKRHERLTLSLPLPAVNQLRYAAYHMRKASRRTVTDGRNRFSRDNFQAKGSKIKG